MELSYRDPKKEICVFTDASERFWAAIVTQCERRELEKGALEQKCSGAAFKTAQPNWTMFEKEGFAIFQAFDKLDYLLMSERPAHVFTDHRNFLFVFAPLALEPAQGRHLVSKVQWWALFLSRNSYVIEHIAGDENVFADILTRWMKG